MDSLTRLRRDIRGSSDGWIGDLEKLIDALDQCYEDCQVVERDLSNYNSLDEDTVSVIVQENAERLVKTIGMLGGLYPHNILRWLVSSWGTIGMNILEEAFSRLQAEQKAQQDDEGLGELDDHPF